jgi:Xaa-Pro aminopeptidase
MERAAYLDRLEAAGARMREHGVEALIVGASPDLAYLAGYAPMPMERLTALVLTADRSPRLVVPALERPAAAVSPAADALEIVAWTDEMDPYGPVEERLPRGGAVAVDDRLWSSHLLALQALDPGRRWLSGTAIVGGLRMRKDADELSALRRAAHAADEAFADALGSSFEGATERSVATRLAGLLVDHGHTAAAFTIVGSGPNAASPHHEPGDRIMERGDAIVLDFGGVVDGYHSDITRTAVIGEPSRELRTVHDVVAAARTAAIGTIRPGVPIERVDQAARSVIVDAGYGDRFIHRTGHGIGLEVHEPPYAVAGDDTVLEPGMTFSVEPGIYLDGRFGVRIEDIVVVTDGGVEVLNEAPRDLATVS